MAIRLGQLVIAIAPYAMEADAGFLRQAFYRLRNPGGVEGRENSKRLQLLNAIKNSRACQCFTDRAAEKDIVPLNTLEQFKTREMTSEEQDNFDAVLLNDYGLFEVSDTLMGDELEANCSDDAYEQHFMFRGALLKVAKAWVESQSAIDTAEIQNKVNIAQERYSVIKNAFENLKKALEIFMEWQNDPKRVNPKPDHNIIAVYLGGGDTYRGHVMANRCVVSVNNKVPAASAQQPSLNESQQPQLARIMSEMVNPLNEKDQTSQNPRAINLPLSFGVYDDPIQKLTGEYLTNMIRCLQMNRKTDEVAASFSVIIEDLKELCMSFWSKASQKLIKVSTKDEELDNSLVLMIPKEFSDDYKNGHIDGKKTDENALNKKVFVQWELPMFVLQSLKKFFNKRKNESDTPNLLCIPVISQVFSTKHLSYRELQTKLQSANDSEVSLKLKLYDQTAVKRIMETLFNNDATINKLLTDSLCAGEPKPVDIKIKHVSGNWHMIIGSVSSNNVTLETMCDCIANDKKYDIVTYDTDSCSDSEQYTLRTCYRFRIDYLDENVKIQMCVSTKLIHTSERTSVDWSHVDQCTSAQNSSFSTSSFMSQLTYSPHMSNQDTELGHLVDQLEGMCNDENNHWKLKDLYPEEKLDLDDDSDDTFTNNLNGATKLISYLIVSNILNVQRVGVDKVASTSRYATESHGEIVIEKLLEELNLK